MTPTPTPQQLKELTACLNAMARYPKNHLWDQLDSNVCQEAAMLLERFGQAPAVQHEPVAWMYDWLAPGHDKPVCDWISQDKDEVFDQRNGYFNIRPLYTHPAPAEVREPLTREQVKRMWREFSPLIGGIFDLVAAVEKHHGITGSKA